MTRDETTARDLLQSYGLSEKHVNLCKDSYAQLRPPYHNEQHCFSTAVTFHELAVASKLTHSSLLNGLVAAIYHDARHIMAPNDERNIDSSVWYLRQRVMLDDDLNPSEVERLIRATLNTKRAFHYRDEVVLHDADVLQTVKGSYRENAVWRERLVSELGGEVTPDSSFHFVNYSLLSVEGKELLRRALDV